MNCWYEKVCNLKDTDCKENCIRFNNMKILVENSCLPLDLQYPHLLPPDEIDLKSFNSLNKIKKNIDKFVEQGGLLYLWSKITGNGKTTWSAKLLMAYFDKVWAYSQLKCRGIYLYTPTFLNALKTQFINNISLSEYISNIKNADLVIFDDLGVGKLSDFDKSNLLDVIDFRLNNHKSTIFTSNLDYTQLVDLFGDRLSSRIYNSSTIIELKGSDKRGVN